MCPTPPADQMRRYIYNVSLRAAGRASKLMNANSWDVEFIQDDSHYRFPPDVVYVEIARRRDSGNKLGILIEHPPHCTTIRKRREVFFDP
jgi:hypothetical protein